ncbi:NADH:ubiquinone reductase (Na(+)-transporting) subunit D [Miniphocaeibacter halophilus]|uniref:NADH:ubiquinone reductase (Na(+)-transporting) subunit D n=1 Tax=Miniphocaeibacter halophilus TaxID=2931922 RepID=A0AC61NCH0_9FIRM|nr:NADH:ubiquinone reductase (Na(+)-transporting) subunit D [Miniphocaeibacter halophilus]QQK08648.1 NADH:ubiquinone reductase (Na(+)-transporting) subunit D [Miniphocaeibacter halophilus]
MAGKTNYKKIISDALLYDNPVLVQVIGLCSTLAVTNLAMNSLVMGIALAVVTAFSSLTISLLRNITPKHIRMMVQVFVISFYVIIVDIFLKAYMPEMSKTLGPYVGLIITNCIIMGRAEAFAIANKPIPSFVDGFISGIGYTIVLLLVAFVRELLGFGSLFGIRILPQSFTPWTMMVMPPGAFFILPIIMWIAYNIRNKKKGAKK